MTLTPTRPGEAPQQPTLLPSVPLLEAPGLDDLGDLPLELPLAGVLEARRRACAGSGRRVGRSRASLRRARRATLCLLNAERRARGLRRLRPNGRLRRAAERHSRSMIRRAFFSHFEPSGSGPIDRARRANYFSGRVRATVGENLGYGRTRASAPRGMVRSWMHSTTHRANVLHPRYVEVGVGIVPGVPGHPGSRGVTYTTDFGVRSR